MIILNNDKQLYISASGLFLQDTLDWTAQYLDVLSDCSFEGPTEIQGSISGSGGYLMVDNTGSIQRRDIKFIKVHNKDSQQTSVRFFCSGSGGETTIFDGTIRSGHTLFYNALGEFVIRDSFGCETKLDRSFLDLLDTPGSYIGADGKIVTVSGSGLIFTDLDVVISGSVTASFAQTAETASFALTAETASFALTASCVEWLNVKNKPFSLEGNNDVDTGSAVIDSFPTSDGKCAEWFVCISSGSNLRASKVLATWLSPDVEWTEHSTQDIGQTNKIALEVQLNGGNVELVSVNSGIYNDWEIETLRTII